MIIESLVFLGTATALGLSVGGKDKKLKNNIESIWKDVMQGIGTKAENKLHVDYKILEIFPKHYGFDAIVEIPYGADLKQFRSIVPSLESAYNSDIIVDYATKKNSLYMRCKLISIQEIAPRDDIRFKWQKSFTHYNDRGETFTITKISDIVNPNKKDLPKEEQIVGYKLNVEIPLGLNYETLQEYENALKQKYKKCFMFFDNETGKCTVNIITKPIADSEKYIPVKVKYPWELYISMNYSYQNIISDLSKKPHFLYTGQSQTGKSVCALTAITNTAFHFDVDDFWWLGSMISAKQDLKVFKDLKHCKYYATNVADTVKMLLWAKREMNRRNRLFETSKKGHIGNAYEWNKKYPKQKLPFILISIDEMTLYMPMTSDADGLKKMKQKCIDLIIQIIVESASSGINLMFSLQRPDKDSFHPQIKAQIGTLIGFFQMNGATSLVAMDSTKQTTLAKKREAIVKYQDGEEVIKTLYLDFPMIENLLKDKLDKNHEIMKLDNNGIEIIEEKGEETDENEQKTTKNEQNIPKTSEKSNKNDKKDNKTSNNPIDNMKKNLKDKKNKDWEQHKNRKGA